MGNGYEYSKKEGHQKLLEIKQELQSHINYKDCIPKKNESQIKFTLRAISHLVSPPQEPHESTTIECTDLARAILITEEELEFIWKTHHDKN